jgi:hypothetical protein
MKIKEFEDFNLKKDQRIKVYCFYNGKQELFAKGQVDKISKRQYKKFLERLNESAYYHLKIKFDSFDYENDCDIAEINSYQIADIFFN